MALVMNVICALNYVLGPSRDVASAGLKLSIEGKELVLVPWVGERTKSSTLKRICVCVYM